jgi:hypothetical protein
MFEIDACVIYFPREAFMKAIILFVFKCVPLILGLGFLAPLIGQSLTHFGLESIWNIPSIYVGLLIGGTWGAIAAKTGRWI